MKKTIYFCPPETLYNTYEEKICEAAIETCFECRVENHHFHQKKTDGDLFDVLMDAEGIVVLPYKNGQVTQKTEWCVKLMVLLKKTIYLMTPELTILRVHTIEKTETKNEVPQL